MFPSRGEESDRGTEWKKKKIYLDVCFSVNLSNISTHKLGTQDDSNLSPVLVAEVEIAQKADGHQGQPAAVAFPWATQRPYKDILLGPDPYCTTHGLGGFRTGHASCMVLILSSIKSALAKTTYGLCHPQSVLHGFGYEHFKAAGVWKVANQLQ